MPTQFIKEFPSVATINLDDVLIIEQTQGAVTTTYQTTVKDLLGSFAPVPTITNLTWSELTNQLEVKGANLLPTTLVSVDNKFYAFQIYQGGTTASIKFTIEAGLPVGSHEVKVKNFIHETSDTLIVE